MIGFWLVPSRFLASDPPAKVLPCLYGQGRIRTSVARKERQIYSLLPLTTRPPVRAMLVKRQELAKGIEPPTC